MLVLDGWLIYGFVVKYLRSRWEGDWREIEGKEVVGKERIWERGIDGFTAKFGTGLVSG